MKINIPLIEPKEASIKVSDIETLKQALNNIPKITELNIIPDDVVDYLKNNPDMIQYVFDTRRTGYGSSKKFFINAKCSCCGDINQISLPKGKLVDYIKQKEEYFCPKCLDFKKEQELIKDMEEREARNKQRIEELDYNTQYYINNYLDTDNSWKPDVKHYKKIELLCNVPIYDSVVSDYINGMDYNDFLSTPYWKGIAHIVKHKANYKCEFCYNTNNLNVHHKTYIHHGLEHRYYKTDLICLCKNCHSRFHNKEY